jgi:hypothetical protein
MPIKHIARLVGHTSTAVTETVYRQQIRPVIVEGPKPWTASSVRAPTAPEPVVTHLVTQ